MNEQSPGETTPNDDRPAPGVASGAAAPVTQRPAAQTPQMPGPGFPPAPAAPSFPPFTAPQMAPPPPSSGGGGSLLVTCVVVAVVTAIVFGGGGFAVGFAVRGGGTAAAPRAAVPTPSVSNPAITAAPSATGIAISDATGDAQSNPVSGGTVYGPTDIASVSVQVTDEDLEIRTTFAPSVDVSLASAQLSIITNPSSPAGCDDSVLPGATLAIDLDATGTGNVLSRTSGCQPSDWNVVGTAYTTSSGTTLVTVVGLVGSGLELQRGQRVTVRASASTRIDSQSTTTIQDYAPDEEAGTTGTL